MRSGKQSKLQVWGDAIKFNSTSSWDIPSDARYKKDVKPFTDGLAKLKSIEPVSFRYDEKLGLAQDSNIVGIGVLAQDIQKVFPYTVKENTLYTSRIIKDEKRYQVDAVDTTIIQVNDSSKRDEHGHFAMKDSVTLTPIKKWVVEPREFGTDSLPLLTYNPSALTYVIVNSIKELDSSGIQTKEELLHKISIQNFTIDSLQLAVKNLEERVARLETKNQVALNEVSDVILEQNNPNPFATSTTITYYIPENISGLPQLVITPTSRTQILKTIDLQKGLPTQLTVSASEFDTGVYVYSIVIDNKVLATKKFIIIK